jgi:hypothetical protein
MSLPAFIIAEMKSSDGTPLSTITVMPKNFKTGSRGFYANQKLEIGGKRYQMQLQLVEIGSKQAKDEEENA